jgi:hypothetical protein
MVMGYGMRIVMEAHAQEATGNGAWKAYGYFEYPYALATVVWDRVSLFTCFKISGNQP